MGLFLDYYKRDTFYFSIFKLEFARLGDVGLDCLVATFDGIMKSTQRIQSKGHPEDTVCTWIQPSLRHTYPPNFLVVWTKELFLLTVV